MNRKNFLTRMERFGPICENLRQLARDEWVLLASDGILSLAEAGVHAIVRPTGATAQARVDALLDAVEQAAEPEQDNCTVVLLPRTMVSAKAARRPMAMVLGTLAIIAGLWVVGAAGWELLRLNRPHLTGTAMRAKTLPTVPPSEAAAVRLPAPSPKTLLKKIRKPGRATGEKSTNSETGGKKDSSSSAQPSQSTVPNATPPDPPNGEKPRQPDTPQTSGSNHSQNKGPSH